MGIGGVRMEFDDNFIRRMNDKKYQIALARYVEKLCKEEGKIIEKKCKENPFLKKRIEYAEDKVNSLSNEEFVDFISTVIQKNAERIADKVEEFSKNWDKEHYKVIYHNFNQPLED